VSKYRVGPEGEPSGTCPIFQVRVLDLRTNEWRTKGATPYLEDVSRARRRSFLNIDAVSFRQPQDFE